MGHFVVVVVEEGDDVHAALADLVAEVVMALVVIVVITVLPQVEVDALEVEAIALMQALVDPLAGVDLAEAITERAVVGRGPRA